MSKSKWHKRKGRKKEVAQIKNSTAVQISPTPPIQEDPPQSRLTRGWKLFWSFLVSASVVIGLIISYYSFVPKVAITPGNTDPKLPFETPFFLVNNSMVPIYKVSFSPVIIELTDAVNAKANNIGVNSHDVFEKIKPGKQTTIGLRRAQEAFMFRYPLRSATAEIEVKYHLWLYPKEFVERFRFRLGGDSTGTQFWLPVEQ